MIVFTYNENDGKGQKMFLKHKLEVASYQQVLASSSSVRSEYLSPSGRKWFHIQPIQMVAKDKK